MISRLFATLIVAFSGAPLARATPYWVAYEGNDFPENEGWLRTYGDGTFPPHDQPDRSLENGELVISTARNPSLWEYYSRGLLDPGSGERFEAEWRVLATVLSGPLDDGVTFARSSSPGHVSFYCQSNGLLVQTDGALIPLDMSVSHTFHVESPDMVRYALSVDDQEVYMGFFQADSLLRAYVAFGPDVQGASSVSRWDYFRFGVIPEPMSALLWTGLSLALLTRR